MSITKKKGVSIWAYVLIGLLVVAVIVLAVLHIAGLVDLSFVGEGFMGMLVWAATDPMNGALLFAGVFTGGILACYVFMAYLVGTKISTTTLGGYNPPGQQISQQQTQDETVVSD